MHSNPWDAIYQKSDEQLPWFCNKLDYDLDCFLQNHFYTGAKLLEIGAGTGIQSAHLKNIGFDVTATDISSIAINKAIKKHSGEIKFILDDILNTKLCANTFDFVLDRGVFHSIHRNGHKIFIKNINKLLKNHSYYVLKCLSKDEARPIGPLTFSKEDILNIFSPYFKVITLVDSYFPTPKREKTPDLLLPKPLRAIFAVMEKRCDSVK